jgi:hypothetical protein
VAVSDLSGKGGAVRKVKEFLIWRLALGVHVCSKGRKGGRNKRLPRDKYEYAYLRLAIQEYHE